MLYRFSHFIMNFLLLFLSISACFALMAASPSQSSNESNDITELQKHVSFFDRNNDGIIYPKETFKGLRAIGFGFVKATTAAMAIHFALSSKTRPGLPPDMKLPIVVKNIHLAKHGSDTGAYDKTGRFVPSKFEEIFGKHAHTKKDSLTLDELNEMLKDNKKDQAGGLASSAEWKQLYDLAKDKNGLLHKDTVCAVYDGSLFEQLAKKNAQSEN